MAKSKVVSPSEAAKLLRDGMTVMMGGFTNVGSANKFVLEMVKSGLKDITLISNDAGNDKFDGIGTLICQKRVKKLIASHAGLNPQVAVQMNAGELEVELVPQGTLAERIRCGGTGLGGVLTPTGIGTVVAEGKQIINVNGKDYLLETPLRADVAVIKAWKADEFGNLVYRRAARNFNPMMAMAADIVIAEVEEVVPVGEIDPDMVMTPGVCVDYVVKM
ncbi:MAG TPA: 3-oxoacid CoA-transferase subunit A [Clostridiales bacterium]|jgi:acetate CoA/acetoacetate CoA-transferase alpha subunit|nr:3-oxoacid CoA-transferase subunit A [Clostridiales bacterium]